MALQNIGAGNRDDAFYRYKMPRMMTKIEGRGNGIKTNIVNMVDIAKALARPAAYTTKYFGCELGAQSKFDEKTGIALVNGSHDTAKLAGLLEIFIKKYVQCYGCGNPETEILITKTQMLQLKCAACGFVSDVDMRDKLTTFILKNPPEVKKSKDKKALRRAEKERLRDGEAADKASKQKKPSKEGASKSTKKKTHGSDEEHSPTESHSGDNDLSAVVDDDDEDGDDVQWLTDTSMEAAKMRIKEQLSAVTADMVILTTEEEPTRKKSPPRKPEPEVKESNGALSVDPQESLVKNLKEYLKNVPTANQLKTHLSSCSGTPQEVVDAVFEALFDGLQKGFAKEVNKKKNYIIAALAYAEGSQPVLLHAIESFCGKASLDAVKEVAVALKFLYDADLLEEESIVEWYEKGSTGDNQGSAVWKFVKPFVVWLQSAESESEEEE
ncbi:hypothetical protein SOVF_033420 [Spinacia oleracea]|uniref:Eukaryotic translation initiation factor 5 n=1 Tax=Spinacia oleracea TaxID=3562 RepID=A0A9R0K0K6_SPIOL|nr:eukaryotic translation initiation factor 5-like [Spinacia oleracea]KNA22469.1 hypothetical protein SOVF_033420 [Spinacia oleracea]